MPRTFDEAILDAVRRLNGSGSAYAVSGSVAKSLYGAPAFSKDLDVLAADPERVQQSLRPAFSLLVEAGDNDAYEDVSGFVVEVFKARTDVEREMLQRARPERLGSEHVPVLEPTDWTAMKLREAKHSPVEADRHLADARVVARLQRIDCDRLADLARRMGTERQFKEYGHCEMPKS